jgi:hypothetical protein
MYKEQTADEIRIHCTTILTENLKNTIDVFKAQVDEQGKEAITAITEKIGDTKEFLAKVYTTLEN